MPLRRKKTFIIPREAGQLGPYDERPMLPDDVHMQVYLSRNDRPQPFFLICEKDTVLAVFSGTGNVEFRGTSVNAYALEPGDHVYVPAGTPTRLVPTTESVILRYKAREPGLEGVAWYCDACHGELARRVFDTRVTHAQAGYLDGVRWFNADAQRRSCRCGWQHPAVDLSPYRWEQLAADLAS